MTLSCTKILVCFSCLLAFIRAGQAQDIPAVTGGGSAYQGFALPAAGELTYSVTATQSGRFGYYGSVISSTAFSGNLAYLSGSALNPFRITSASGYQHTSGYVGTRKPSQFFENLMVSQEFHLRRWDFTAHDSVAYLPDAPSSGSLAGIPGLGDVGVTNPDPNQDILTNFVTRVSNSAGVSVSRPITGRTTMDLNAEYDILKFVGQNTTNALSNNNISGSASITHAISPIRSYFFRYTQSHFTYPDISVPFSFDTESLVIGYSANLSRQTKYTVSAGPQHTSSETTNGLSGSFDANIQASVIHTGERSSSGANFSRSIRGGSGVTPGSLSQNLIANYSYRLSRVSSVSATASYLRSSRVAALTTSSFGTDTINGSVQGARSIGRFYSAYISYSLLKQSLSGSANNNTAFNGVSHILAGGITYSPRGIHLGHQ